MIRIKKIKGRVNKSLALFEIVFLILGTIAIAYSLGSYLSVVSAQGPKECFLEGDSLWKKLYSNNDDWVCIQGSCLNSGDLERTNEEMCTLPLAGGRAAICGSPPDPLEVKESFLIECLVGQEDPSVDLPSTSEIIGLAGIAERFFGPSTVPTPTRFGSLFEGSKFGLAGESPGVPSIFDPNFKPSFGSSTPPSFGSTPPAESINFFSGLIATQDISWGQIIANAGVAAILFAYAAPGLEKLGVPPHWARAAGRALAVTYTVRSVAAPILSNIGGGNLAAFIAGPYFLAAVFVLTFFFSFKETQVKIITFTCNPWSPPKGGNDCELCNQNELGCSEYQCRSLGASCEIVNRGTTEELCTWINRNDVQPPSIEAWEDVLSVDYIYTPDNAISPPDRGVKIVPIGSGSCIEAFFPIEFGVTLDEPAKCKITPVREDSFEDMGNNFFQSGSTYKHNHSQKLPLPGPSSLASENITLINGGVMDFFVRCEDRNGNSNAATFSFNFCVDDGPDTTPPLIVETGIINGAPISANQTSTDLDVFVNEPSECRWDKLDKDYDDMETQMSCSTSVLSRGPRQLYQCSTVLTGLKDKVDNDFYFRCKDQPHLVGTEDEDKRNKNSQSYKFTLVGTQPLVINELSPNGITIKDSTDVIKVTLKAETSAGYNEGEAICSYEGFGTNDRFIEFIETNSFQHSQDLFLPEGDYTYEIRCVDLGGNADNGVITFSVESDNQAPEVVRVYREGASLKVITNEESECVYDGFDCNYLFDDGIKMNSVSDKEHFTTWDPDLNFYIKCRDEFLNEPLPNSCSIVVRPFEK